MLPEQRQPPKGATDVVLEESERERGQQHELDEPEKYIQTLIRQLLLLSGGGVDMVGAEVIDHTVSRVLVSCFIEFLLLNRDAMGEQSLLGVFGLERKRADHAVQRHVFHRALPDLVCPFVVMKRAQHVLVDGLAHAPQVLLRKLKVVDLVQQFTHACDGHATNQGEAFLAHVWEEIIREAQLVNQVEDEGPIQANDGALEIRWGTCSPFDSGLLCGI